MKPPARTLPRQRRLLPVLAGWMLATQPAVAEETQCRAPVEADPRVAELLQHDPADPRIEITSDEGELGRAGDATLSGNVRIRQGQRLLSAEAAEIDANARRVRLTGGVEYLDPTLRVRGLDGEFAGGEGSVRGAEFTLTERAVRGVASDVRLRGESVLDLEGVRYTACPPGRDDWELRADRISIDQQNRVGTGRDVRLEFKGVPILYTPWITFPVGEERKSGFLFPGIGNGSRTGTQVTVPWYWNMAPNYDATFTTRWFSSRGLRVDPEFRYLTRRSRGSVNVEYLFEDLETNEPRSFVDVRHTTLLEPTTRLTLDAAYASDDQYFEDFGVGFEGTSVTFLDQRGEVRRDTRHWSLTGSVQNYQVLDDALPDADQPYSILPQAAAVGRWRGFGPGLAALLRAEAVNFQRDTGTTGVRVDVEPSLDWRAQARGSYLAASVGWRATAYSLADAAPGADDAPMRSLPTLSAETGVALERDVGTRGQRLLTLEPRLLYLYVPYRDQDDLPVFDTALPDLNLVQLFRTNRYVGADRVGDANQFSLGVTSRLLDSEDGRQYLSATLGQAFYLEDPRVRLPDEPVRERSSSDVVAELDLTAFKDWSARLGYQWNPDQGRSEKSEFYLQYRPASNRLVNAGYRYTRDLLEQVDVSVAWPISGQWRGFGRWVYSLYEEKTLDQFVGVEFSSCCYAIRVVTRRYVSSRTGDSDTSIGLQLELKGLSSVGVDNEAFLREAIRGYSALPSDPLP